MKTYDELLAERDQMAAKAAALDALIVAMQERATLYLQPNGEPDANFISYILTMLDGPEQRAAQADPVQYLAEIKAEAGRAGYVAGAEMWVDFGAEPEYKAGCLIGIEADAGEYAAKIRNTGTWLKDSNVNGGKRQGGEK